MRASFAFILVGVAFGLAGCGEPSPPKADDPEVVRPKLELPKEARDGAGGEGTLAPRTGPG